MKLRQGQVWKQGGEYLRIVRLERREVEYKSTTSFAAKAGTHLRTSKKEFCRLLKRATLLPPTQAPPTGSVRQLRKLVLPDVQTIAIDTSPRL
jgi:hypothetical protein